MDLNKKEAEAILSIAKKIIVAIEKNNNKMFILFFRKWFFEKFWKVDDVSFLTKNNVKKNIIRLIKPKKK